MRAPLSATAAFCFTPPARANSERCRCWHLTLKIPTPIPTPAMIPIPRFRIRSVPSYPDLLEAMKRRDKNAQPTKRARRQTVTFFSCH